MPGTGALGEGGLLDTGLLGKGSPSGADSGVPIGAGNEPSRAGVLGTGWGWERRVSGC